MSSYDPNVIRAQIKTLLQTVTELAYVYSYLDPDIEGYPCAIFDVSNEDADMMDDANNLRKLTFTIWVVVEVSVKTQEQAVTLLDSASKAVINILEKKTNDTLSNTVDWTMPVMGERRQVPSPEGNVMYQEVKLRCNIASTIL